MAAKERDRLVTRDVGLVMASGFCFFAANMLVTPLMAGFSESLGATGAVMGLAAGAMSIVSLVCRPIAGLLSDRASKRLLVGVGAALYLVSNVWYAAAGSSASLIVARMLNGVGFACCSVCLATWVASLLPLRHMGAGMGLYGTMNALAMAIGPAVGIKAQQLIGYRATFLIAAALALGMVGAVFLVRDGGHPAKSTARSDEPTTPDSSAPEAGSIAPAHPVRPTDATQPTQSTDVAQTSYPDQVHTGRFHTEQTGTARPRLQRLLNAIVEPRVVPLALVFMLFALPYFANQSFLVTYVQARGLRVEASLFFPLYAVALLVMRLTLRDLFDRWPFRRFLALCSVSLLGMLACLTFLANDWTLLLAGILTAGSYGLMSSVTQSQAVLIAGRERSGMANSTYYIGIDLGMSLGPLIAGFLYEHAPIAWFYPLFALVVPAALALHAATERFAQAR